MKNFKTKTIAVIAALAALFVTNVTFAWFTGSSNSVSPQIDGGLIKEYFHSGSGSEDDPFVITRPVHYYHMVEFFQRTTALPLTSGQNAVKALFGKEYLYFRIGAELDENNEGVYYVYSYYDDGTCEYETDENGNKTPKLCKSLNMQCYSGDNALMPIGSSEVPFIGEIDGKGIEIKNLHIVSRSTVNVKITGADESVTEKTVTRTTSDIGVFGCVGKSAVDKNGETKFATIKDIFFSCVNIDLADLKIGEYGDKNEIAESHDDDQHLIDPDSGSAEKIAYAGYLAGHVYTTTNIKGVYLNDCTISGGTTAKSGFGMFGYIYDPDTDEAVTSLGDFVKELNPDGSQSWGASIDMKDIFDRLTYFEGKASATKNGKYNELEVYDENGKIIESESKKDISMSSYQFTSAGVTYTVTLSTYYSDKEGSFHFTYITDESKNTVGDEYKKLYGASSKFITTTIRKTGKTDTINGFYICNANSGTKNYMCYDVRTNDIVNSTSASTVWSLTDEGYLKLRNVISANDAFYADETERYVNLKDNALVVSSAGATVWEKTDDQIYTTDTDGAQRCIYYGSVWTVSSGTSETKYRIKYNNNYMTVNVGSLGVTSNSADATLFVVKDKSDDGGFYLQVAGDTQCLGLVSVNYLSNGKLNVSSGGYKFYLDNGNLYIVQPNNTRRDYVYCDQTLTPPWRVNSSKKGATLEEASSVSYNAYSETTSVSVTLATIEKKKNGSDTYFPIRVGLDDNANGDYSVSEENTGYIIAGANVEDAVSLANNIKEKAYGDIRVSKFAISNINGSYVNNAFSEIYTEGASGRTKYTGNSEAYQTAIKSLSETLSGSSYVYGLHFMDAKISMDHIITAKNVTIKKNTYAEYQFPEDCIDFHVGKRGTINFFAGTYFTGNDTFFSLHVITRSGSEITRIREISKIYSKGGIYYYYYADDETDNYGGNSDYTLEFDCKWITDPSALTNNSLYYFEIPVNAGEYALGSVSGKNGAYLIYLDIAANSDGTTETIIGTNEDNKLVTDTFSKIDYRTQDQIAAEQEDASIQSDGGLMQYSVIAPESTGSAFSVKVEFVRDENECDGYGIYKIYITDALETDDTVEFLVCLFDDDDSKDEYKYGYQIYFNGEQKFTDEGDYFQSVNKFEITKDGIKIAEISTTT